MYFPVLKQGESKVNLNDGADLILTFQVCEDQPECLENPIEYLKGKNFRFPAIQRIFDEIDPGSGTSVITSVDDRIVVPFN